ncbi:hypothetical protein KJA15_01205 [Patescibacteria group bacterium]|nr:hypothetical protein [Patescibacteria group bacterium]
MELKVGTLVVNRYHKTFGIVVEEKGGGEWVLRCCSPLGTDVRDVLSKAQLKPLLDIPESERELPIKEILEKYQWGILARAFC